MLRYSEKLSQGCTWCLNQGMVMTVTEHVYS